ncbi:hypothetical protein ACIKTA_06965, partial [Hansschlegelia beijingensis]
TIDPKEPAKAKLEIEVPMSGLAVTSEKFAKHLATPEFLEGRRTVEAGTLVADKVEQEVDGPCRDVNFDPTVLPSGIRTSDDPFPAARSAAYAVSFDRRTAEAKHYGAQ